MKEFSFNKIPLPLENLFPSRSVCKNKSACDLMWLLGNAFLVVCSKLCTKMEGNEKRAINKYLHIKRQSVHKIHLDMKEVLENDAPLQETVYR